MRYYGYYVLRKLMLCLALVIILSALLVSVLRLVSPVINQHRFQFEEAVTAVLHHPVHIEKVQIHWRGLNFALIMNGITLNEKNDVNELKINKLQWNIALLESLLKRKLVIKQTLLKGLHINVMNNDAGEFDKLTGYVNATFFQPSVVTTASSSGLLKHILILPNIKIQDIVFSYHDKATTNLQIKSLVLKPINQTNEMSWMITQINFAHAGHLEKKFSVAKMQGIASLLITGINAPSVTLHDVAIINNDFKIYSHLQIIFNRDNPFVDLNTDFEIAHMNQLSRYLPTEFMNASLADWLCHAFEYGQVKKGELKLKGFLKQFPFKAGEGIFKVDAEIVDARLHYAENFPDLRAMQGRIAFENHSMNLYIQSGVLANIPVKNIFAYIPYIGYHNKPVLFITGNASSPVEKILASLNASYFKTYFSHWQTYNVMGYTDLKMFLKIPLSELEKMEYEIKLALSDMSLSINTAYLNIKHLQGWLRYHNQQGMRGELHGMLFDNPIDLLVQPINKVTQVQFKTTVSIASLAKNFPHVLWHFAQGTTELNGFISLLSQNQDSTLIQMNSDLRGVAIDVPKIYKKNSATKNNLHVVLLNHAKELNVKINYDDTLRTFLNYAWNNHQFNLAKGYIAINSSDISKHDGSMSPGLTMNVTLPRFNLSDWEQLYEQIDSQGMQTNLPAKITLHTKKFTAWDASFVNLKLVINRLANRYHVKFNSADLLGQLIIPQSFNTGSINGYFKRVHINKWHASSDHNSMDLTQLPSINLSLDELTIQGRPWGKVLLQTKKTPNGMRINQLRVVNSLMSLQAYGKSARKNKHIENQLKGQINSSHLTQALTHLGLPVSHFMAKKAKAYFVLSSMTAPHEPYSLDKIKGTISINIGEGRIYQLSDANNVKVDIGRLLNIFSLKTLQRRLNFNFSDLSQNGYSFDNLRGEFFLKDGNVFTNNLHFDGPVAGISVKGRIGLQEKDCNLNLNVKPYYTSSLPIVAAMAGGPVAGVATFVFDKMLSNAVNDASAYHYDVSGKWENPVWQQIHPS